LFGGRSCDDFHEKQENGYPPRTISVRTRLCISAQKSKKIFV
jgi:hypothetical protein